ncbi:MAG: exodeoxyribonuclease VII large subunit [Gammaproteobacteria bacterium]|nr:exodeoxyribonuclease VII large subunit [Gammaproteobacteria bacterium]
MNDLFEPQREIFTVSRLNREASLLLEEGFGRLWIEGELSGLARPSSGHLYFSLKDERAQIRCAMFRQHNRKLTFALSDGLQVLLRARVSLYEPRGDYQLIVEHMEEAGLGQLQREFEALKARLAAEGLFDEARKRALPLLPRRIGVVTSPTGAALRDILTTLKRRFAAVPVRIYPTQVQGRTAAGEIAEALSLASRRGDCDVLILARGGGSLEDLWAFNEEVVARAIVASRVPVIAGIGHEVDITIADFAADLRAPTPTGAAERAVPDSQEWLQRLHGHYRRLRQEVARVLTLRDSRLAALSHRLTRVHPGMRLARDAQRLDGLERRLSAAMSARLARRPRPLDPQYARIGQHSPALRLRDLAHRHALLAGRLTQAMQQQLRSRQQSLATTTRALAAVSPLATLERGYAILTRADGRVLRNAADTAPGEPLMARLAHGQLETTVVRCEPEEQP